MLGKLRDILSAYVANIYFNIRSVNEVPLEYDEFASVYVDSTTLEHPHKVQTSYVIVYAKKSNDPQSTLEFENFQKRTLSICTDLQKLLANASMMVQWGGNDAYFFAQINLSVKEALHV